MTGRPNGSRLWLAAVAAVGVLAVAACALFGPGFLEGWNKARSTEPAFKVEVSPGAIETSAAQAGSRDLKAKESMVGKTVFVMANLDLPPMPKAGFPAPRFASGRKQLAKVLRADDLDGLVATADEINFIFCRAGTKAVVLGQEEHEGEQWCEARLKSGPNPQETVWLPAAFLGRWAKPGDLDPEKWSPNTRNEIHKGYKKALQIALEQAGADVGSRFDPEGRLALVRRRHQFEEAAAKRFAPLLAEVAEARGIDTGTVLKVVLHELAAGEVVDFEDR
jgi:hypothetical protein